MQQPAKNATLPEKAPGHQCAERTERAVPTFRPTLTLALVLSASLFAQDERRVRSPDGQLEFRIFVSTQTDSNLSRLAYEVFYRNHPVIAKSFLGLDIQDQEPLLGENVGLTSSTSTTSPKYNSLTAKYMQNGSLGRLINVEVRASNDQVAFRYEIPKSTPLIELNIVDETTEFRPLNPGQVTITESELQNYPPMHLGSEGEILRTRLDHPYRGTTPLTCPWRIIRIK